MAASGKIRAGDRIDVQLPVRVRIRSRWRWVPGTVTRVDDGGVHLDLDYVVNGLKTAYATYGEVVKTAAVH